MDWLKTVSLTPFLVLLFGLFVSLPAVLVPFSFSVSPYLALGLCWAFVPPFPSLSIPLSLGAFFDCLFAFGAFSCPALLAVLCTLGFGAWSFWLQTGPGLFVFFAWYLPSGSVIVDYYIPVKTPVWYFWP